MCAVPRNIELFNRIVAITLVRLYESFPNPLQLDSSDIGAQAAANSEDEAEVFQLVTQTAENSINFLVQEGFIRFDATSRCLSDNGVFPEAMLTLPGFTLLGATPQSIDGSIDRRPYIEQLKSAVAEGARASIPEIIKSLFTGAITASTSAISG